MKLNYLFISIFLSAAGCVVAVPMHELNTPETLGPWGFRLGIAAGSAPAFVTPQATTTQISEAAKIGIGGYHIGIGLPSNLQLNLEAMNQGTSVGMSASLKWQLGGANYFQAKAGNVASAVSLRYWSSVAPDFKLSDISSTSSYYSGELTAKGFDVSYSLGKRFSDWFAGYLGPKIVSGNIEAGYRNTSGGPIVLTESRPLSGAGAFAGISLSPHGEKAGFDFNIEGEFMNLPSSFNDEKVWYTTFMMMVAVPFRF